MPDKWGCGGVVTAFDAGGSFYGLPAESSSNTSRSILVSASYVDSGGTSNGWDLGGATGLLLVVGLIGVALWVVMSEPARPRFTPAT